MKKFLQLLCIVIIALIHAQNTATRFFYELTYRPNKDSAKLEKELMVLDIDKNQSVYQSYEFIRTDSLANIMVTKMMKTGLSNDFSMMGKSGNAKFIHQVVKNFPVEEILYKEQIFMDYYSYRENPGLTWQISDQKQKVGPYSTQKATTDFGGRKWTAWFSTEIPFQDGPYKFYGLPGLIVKIEDEGKNYSWELKGNKQIENIQQTLYMEDLIKKTGLSKGTEISKEKFLEKYEQYKKDPLGSMKQMFGQVSSDGFSLSKEMRQAEKSMKEEFNKNNNSIELL